MCLGLNFEVDQLRLWIIKLLFFSSLLCSQYYLVCEQVCVLRCKNQISSSLVEYVATFNVFQHMLKQEKKPASNDWLRKKVSLSAISKHWINKNEQISYLVTLTAVCCNTVIDVDSKKFEKIVVWNSWPAVNYFQ